MIWIDTIVQGILPPKPCALVAARPVNPLGLTQTAHLAPNSPHVGEGRDGGAPRPSQERLA